MELKNKTIIIVAQEDWGDMFISKHHYAAVLAGLGNTVYFMNGPDQKSKLRPGEVRITPSQIANLYLLEHRFFYPYIIKFKAPALHYRLVKMHIRNVLKKINHKVDIVWSFDLSNTIPLQAFPDDCLKIFMPVDEPLHSSAIASARGAQIIFSVTNEILEKYTAYDVPKHFINHGVADIFINDDVQTLSNTPLRIGLSGNMLRPDLDHATLLKIMETHQDVVFDIWGTVDGLSSNLVSYKDVSPKALEFVERLLTLKNVVLHGPLKSSLLAQAIKKVDGFLICYDIKKDQSRGTNYHKILEYLATGKVVISNNVTTYKNFPDLIEMSESREHNDALPALFAKVINNLKVYNSVERQQRRLNFAKKFTYRQQVNTIEQLLNSDNRKKGEFYRFENFVHNNA